jgi:type IV pilus assembly protein PilM
VGSPVAKLYFKDKPILGLDISQTGMKVMAVDAKKWLVTGYSSVDLDPAKVQASIEGTDDYLETTLKEMLQSGLLGSLPSNHAILSIPTNRTFTHAFTVPPDAQKHIDDMIALEVDQYIPLPLETLYVDYQIINQSKEGSKALLCAVPKSIVDRCVEIAENSGLRVCAVEPSINAVARLLKFTEDADLTTAIVDIGPASTDIAIFDKTIRVTGSVAVGSNTFTLDIAKHLKVPLENAHQLKVLSGLNAGPRQQKIRSALEPGLKKIVTETRKVMRYYTERIDSEKKIEQLLIVGGGSNVPGIGDYFTNDLVMPARVASPWQLLNFGTLPQPAKQFRPRYITVAGLACVPPKELLK